MPEDETTVENTETEETSDLETEQKEKTVPYDRFSEVYKEKKALETRITELEKKEDKGTLTDKQQQELEAKKYLQGLIHETLSETEKTKEQKEKEELVQFETEVKDFLALNPEVKRADFVKFLKDEADGYGATGVEGAGKLFLKLNDIDAKATDKAKADIKKKPGLPENEGGGSSTGYNPETDRGKSLGQLAHDKIREFGLK